MSKTLKMYFKEGDTYILKNCKYIKIDKRFFGGEIITYLMPYNSEDELIGCYCSSNLLKYKIEEEEDD